MKYPILNSAAEREVEKALRHYLLEAGEALGSRFFTEFLEALDHIAKFPLSGSSRYGAVVNISNLRAWTLKKFPFVIFYVVGELQINVIHFLHQHSDIPFHLQLNDQN